MDIPIKCKIELQKMPVKVFRKVLVPENVNMHQFHLIIQESMGWYDQHLFQFSDKKWRGAKIQVEMPDEMGISDFMNKGSQALILEPEEALLKKHFKDMLDGKHFFYWYDFGDDWWHKISFLKPTKKDLKLFDGVPTCIEAKGACPPENIGGSWGYVDFLEILDDKADPQHKQASELLNHFCPQGKFNPENSMRALDEINIGLREVQQSEIWINSDY